LLCFSLGSRNNNYPIQLLCREVMCRGSLCTAFRLCEDTASIAAFPARSSAVTGKGKQIRAMKFHTCTAGDFTYALHRIRCILQNSETSSGSHAVVVLDIRGTSSCMFSRNSSVSGLVPYTQSFKYLHKEKSHRVMSEDRGD
jgi:hypothetical protein